MNILKGCTEHHCFYCGNDLAKASIHVDHVIPWSYIHSDNLWNLVLACNHCNTSKSDRLPATEFLERLLTRNQKLQGVTEKPIREEYLAYDGAKVRELIWYAEVNGVSGGWGSRRMGV